ncbi:LuxR C-terminal-related transcriptional regulator [Actinotalea sp. M2MS4P-6]|uniref:helix-turn-helix transcriptional regulator n=1 Tax=Actinotalea sp. M2MS4P-6 TaxID=2983762 RepID=UPI0021E3A7ED|nr:LuxR C-terminal-related transcriptional regulator [Actinotalea sp. M2MS4P-6]MCV2394468.1 LuxR C-terminal-related transcriptional regulator [Actinotalea sp. M2MS4P-6]
MTTSGLLAQEAPASTRIVLGPRLKYLGLTLVLAWHYCLWFVPGSFPSQFLLDDRITFAWLIALTAGGVVPLLLAWWLGRRRHLEASAPLVWSVSVLGSAATVALTTVGMSSASLAPAYLSAVVIGASSGVLWVLWGEGLALHRARFTLGRVAPAYGVVMLVVVGGVYLLPGWGAPAVDALLPLASAFLLRSHVRALPDGQYPRLLPVKAAAVGIRTIAIVAGISFAAAAVSYYTVAIVPWEALGHVQDYFTYGILLGAAMFLLLAVVQAVPLWHQSTYGAYPWLLLFSIAACVLYLSDSGFEAPAFLLALAVSSLFEILLTMYMGVLTRRGYVPPATAFALSGGAIRLGILVGNGTALTFERVPGLEDTLVRPTFALLVVMLTALLISMVRQEYAIDALTRNPHSDSELALVVESVAEEFRLSGREREILELIGHGYTASGVAETLVISPHTVNTHVQHIYAKLGIHKRSELISYLHRRG